MHDQQQQQQKPPFHDVRQSVNAFIGLCQIISKPMEAWLRRPGTWGDRYVNHQMLLGWLFIPLFSALLFPREPQGPMLWFMVLTALVLLVHRVRGWRLRRRGYRPHSRYMGRSWVPWASSVNAKCNWEPTLVWMLVPVTIPFCVPLGVYFLVAGSALFFAANWQRDADAARLRQMRDLKWEQLWLMERMQDEEV